MCPVTPAANFSPAKFGTSEPIPQLDALIYKFKSGSENQYFVFKPKTVYQGDSLITNLC